MPLRLCSRVPFTRMDSGSMGSWGKLGPGRISGERSLLKVETGLHQGSDTRPARSPARQGNRRIAALPDRGHGEDGQGEPARPLAEELVRRGALEHGDVGDGDAALVAADALDDAARGVDEGADPGAGGAQQPAP